MRISKTTLLAIGLSSLSACAPEPEAGIDRTQLSGTIHIAPQLSVEDESTVGMNDAISDDPDTEKIVEAAQDLGLLGHRYSLVDGTCHTFSAERDGPPTGDFDYYLFKSQFTGSITVGLSWEDTEITDPDDPPAEEMIWHLSAYDIDDLSSGEGAEELEEGEYREIYDGNTEGNYGSASIGLDLIAGGSYAIRVAGRRALGESDAYRLSISGFDPNGWDDGAGGTTGEATILVGAYTSSDVTARGNPVGGSSVSSYSFDEESMTWSGEYLMWYIRSVTTTEVGAATTRTSAPPPQTDTGGDTGSKDTGSEDTGSEDTGSEDTGSDDTGSEDTGAEDTGTSGEDGGDEEEESEPEPEPEYSTVVDGNISEVWVFAGTFPNLNSGIPSGTLYSSEGTYVSLLDERDAEEKVIDVAVTLDTIQPKLIGWTYTEEEPNDPDYDAKDDLWAAAANDPGLTSGAGYVDIISGTITMTEASGYGEHDEDLIIVRVPAEVYMSITLDWDTADDIDYYVLGPRDGDPVADYEDDSDYYAQPEFGVTRDLLLPEETYYIWIAGYEGTEGSVANYTVELEYLTP